MTKCPGVGTPELTAINIAREKEAAAMSGSEKWRRQIDASWRGRKSTLTPEQRKERNREYQRARYRRLKTSRSDPA